MPVRRRYNPEGLKDMRVWIATCFLAVLATTPLACTSAGGEGSAARPTTAPPTVSLSPQEDGACLAFSISAWPLRSNLDVDTLDFEVDATIEYFGTETPEKLTRSLLYSTLEDTTVFVFQARDLSIGPASDVLVVGLRRSDRWEFHEVASGTSVDDMRLLFEHFPMPSSDSEERLVLFLGSPLATGEAQLSSGDMVPVTDGVAVWMDGAVDPGDALGQVLCGPDVVA